ncbi:MAG: energy-coupling factor ABC transporter ATP-binding protein [Treponema sp.]|jgi:cobalt/nickel transport system ATP-binding protein|nr:energy-coupling factor ABC transporter ATP-binding protein [Treponema sp.]
MARLIINNISHRYDNAAAGAQALEGVSFSVEQGQRVCIAGANGSGKSTLLHIIAACVKPSSGEVGVENGGAGDRAGIVFQDPDNQLFMPTVWEDVAFGVMKKGTNPEEARERALKALSEVDAAHLAERAPHSLSGGEKQRAALAGALILERDILLLDEPTAALDPRARKNLIDLLKNRRGATIIIASHDLDMALELADRIIFLHRGRIAGDCPVPGLLLNEHFLQTIGLELPLGVQGRSRPAYPEEGR